MQTSIASITLSIEVAEVVYVPGQGSKRYPHRVCESICGRSVLSPIPYTARGRKMVSFMCDGMSVLSRSSASCFVRAYGLLSLVLSMVTSSVMSPDCPMYTDELDR